MAVALQSPPRAEPRILPKSEPLEDSDCLTVWRSMHRYEALPHVKKAKLVKRIVYAGSPVRLVHAECHAPCKTGWAVAPRTRPEPPLPTTTPSASTPAMSCSPACPYASCPKSVVPPAVVMTTTCMACPNLSRKSPPAVPPVTSGISSKSMAARACAVTTSGLPRRTCSIGSCWTKT